MALAFLRVYKKLFWECQWARSWGVLGNTGLTEAKAVVPIRPWISGWNMVRAVDCSVLSASELTPISFSQEKAKVEHFLSRRRGMEGRTVASLHLVKTSRVQIRIGAGAPRHPHLRFQRWYTEFITLLQSELVSLNMWCTAHILASPSPSSSELPWPLACDESPVSCIPRFLLSWFTF